MSTLLSPVAIQQFKDNNGNSLIGGQLFTYQAGTSIPAPSYTDATGTSPNTNPVILNSRGEAPLWLTPGQFYKLVLQDASGVLIWTADQVPGGFVDITAGLAASGGTSLIGFIRNVAGAVQTTLAKWLGYQPPSLFDFMTDAQIADVLAGTKTLDVSIAVQTAFNAFQGKINTYKVRMPAGVYRCDSPLFITKPLNIEGDGVSPYLIPNDGNPTGSIFFINHTGKGITVREPTGASLGGVSLRSCGTMRPQPAPVSGWIPTAHDSDIYAESCQLELCDFTFVNPTKGLEFLSTGYGKLNLLNIKGQPLQVGLQVTAAADVVRIDGVHFWPFWKDNDFVHAYTKVNCDGIRLARCDNPMLSNIFTIFERSGLNIVQNSYGTVSKIHLANADFDRGLYGITIDATVTSGVSGQFENVTIQSETGLAGTVNVFISGNNSILQFGNLYCNTAQNNSVRVAGTGNRINISNFRAAEFNLSAAGFPAIEAATGNFVKLSAIPIIYSSAGGLYFGGLGSVKSPLGEGISTAASDVNGDIVVAHNLGMNATIVQCQLQSIAPLLLITGYFSPTNFTVRVLNSTNNTAVVSTAVNFTWRASY